MKITGMSGDISSSTEKGSCLLQEDRFLIHPYSFNNNFGGILLAVMDGYNGPEVAELCRKYIPKLFNPNDFGDVKDSLRRLAPNLNRLAEETSHMGTSSGSCISIACIPRSLKHVFMVSIGDTRIVVRNRYGQFFVSPEHNVRTNKEERNAAKKRGGVYENEYIWIPQSLAHDRKPKGRQISRAIGDVQMGNVISHEPHIYSLPIGPESAVLIASDGLFDPSHGKTFQRNLLSICRGIIFEENAKQLILRSKNEQGGNLRDNTTVVIWRGLK